MSMPTSRNAVEALVIQYAGVWPTIHPQAWLAPTAVLVGDVTVSVAASIFYGAVVRADLAAVTIGEATNLQDNVVVHTAVGYPTVIGPGVSIGHSAVVHGCTVEADCLIGMNATVLNGAVIGEGSLVAAGTVVLEGTQIPPHSLVTGIPGRVRRQLSPGECDQIKENARTYLRLAPSREKPLGLHAEPGRSPGANSEQ